MVGKTLSHYRIVSELGRGGMGIVYQAEDEKLDRTVAIKVLPSATLASDEDRARFYREAKAAAQLHHPYIASVFEIDEAIPSNAPHGTEASPFIVMEFIEGESLQDHIQRGPLKLEEAIRLASQIASGLEAAHEKSIVHRDIKSGNVMLTTKGDAKILDFGLAQTTQSTKLTRMGSTLGTVAYMSPEQARGEEVDRRTDVWSLGVVLFEMIAGRHPFPGDYEQAVIYEILNQDPEPLTSVRTGVPMSLERLVEKCLAKPAERRYQSLTDLLVDLQSERDNLISGTQSLSQANTGKAIPPSGKENLSRLHWPGASLGFLVGLVLAILSVWVLKPFGNADTGYQSERNVMRLELSLPDDLPMAFIGSATNGVGQRALALSPDGSLLVYATQGNQTTQLVLHRMNGHSFDVLSGTEGAFSPIFSPDGEWIAFAANNELSKVRVAGGSPISLAPISGATGFAWSTNGWIYFADRQGNYIRRVLDTGGQVETLTSTRCCQVVSILPDDTHLLVRRGTTQYLQAFNIENEETETLSVSGASAVYAETGHLLYSNRGRLYAVPFDPTTRTIARGAINVIDNLRTESVIMRGQYAVSEGGTLVYATGMPANQTRMVWRDSDGKDVLIDQPEAVYGAVSVSPSGTRLAVEVSRVNGNGIQIIDLDTGISKPLLPANVNFNPVWSPDGTRVAYSIYSQDRHTIFIKDPDVSTRADTILTSIFPVSASAFSPDGRWLTYQEFDGSGSSVWVVSMDDLADRQKVDDENGNSWGARFSLDGKFIAYTAVTTVGSEIVVGPFPVTGKRWNITSEGGEEPIWLPSGNELVYRNGRQWMVVSFATDPSFTASTPQVLFDGPYINVTGFEYDVAPDGRFLLLRPTSEHETTNSLTVITNWFEELKQLAPIE